MARLRAWFRVIGILLLLVFELGGLVLRSSIFGYDRERGFRYRRKYIRRALKILGVSVQRKGNPIDQPALYVSNHRSMLDPMVNLQVIDACIVSKAEVAKYPLVGRGAKETGVIFVDRSDTTSRSAAKDAIRNALQVGESVLIYAEGTTSNVPLTQQFKLGSFGVAAELGIPVVPVALDYQDIDHKWHDGDLFPFFLRKFSSRHIECAMTIGEPLHGETALDLMKQTKSWVNTELERMAQSWPD